MPANRVQSLVLLLSTGIVPVQVTVTVWPAVEGTVMLSVAGVEAKLSHPSDAPIEQRATVIMIRELKKAVCDWEFFRIGFFWGRCRGWTSVTGKQPIESEQFSLSYQGGSSILCRTNHILMLPNKPDLDKTSETL